ncbi:MFS transporter [Rhodopila sp.]|jgi:MFS family permease|uniref:MFS transporter n=1 Tax=Rhodopila sp. TaxID=2480087 RepID=UPI002C68E27C|nr:MFS transporter [Rhodopila sp.]HVZ06386.1 MFS transporter [Rhodopila sp.]
MTAVSPIRTDIPARIDRLPWSRFHLLVVIALGITWVLDGLEVTIIGSIGPMLTHPGTLALTDQDIGTIAAWYVAGAVAGALLFGWMTDRFGRRSIFYTTIGVYIVGVLATAFAWDFWSFALARALTGFGIGGEYAAINSAIDELMPARLRGRIALFINGSYWAGAAAGAGASLPLLSGTFVSVDTGWRLGFGIGAVFGICILALRRFVPESPRWQVTHGLAEEAEHTTRTIEDQVRRSVASALPPAGRVLTIHPRRVFGFGLIVRAMLTRHPGRSALALALMVAQAFLYNSVFFTYGLVLTRFHAVPAGHVGAYILPLTLGNFLGPICLGPLFDTIGRKPMIAGTYAVAGALLAGVAFLFGFDMLSAWGQTLCWMVIFFVASAAASSAYLTASEIFPLETRAMAIALFYALGTLLGGVTAPALFGWLIGTGDMWLVAYGYLFAAGLMIGAAICEVILGVEAAGRPLEDVAAPLSEH